MYFDTSSSSSDTDNLQTPEWDFDIDPEITTAFDGLDHCFAKSDAEFPFSSTNVTDNEINESFSITPADQFHCSTPDQSYADQFPFSQSYGDQLPFSSPDQSYAEFPSTSSDLLNESCAQSTHAESGGETYETNETDRLIMKRSIENFNSKAKKRAKFINNSIEYYGRIVDRLAKPHNTMADVYAADPYLANRHFFDNIPLGKAK